MITKPDRSRSSVRSEGGRRILIDALAARFGGTAYAVVQLAHHLAERQDVTSVIVVARTDSIVERGVIQDTTVRCIAPKNRPRMEMAQRLAWEAWELPQLIDREKCDVVVSMSGMLPRDPGCQVVSLLFNPVMYERSSAANFLRRWAVKRTARKAHSLIAPSQAMADLVRSAVGRDCVVIPLGIDRTVFSPAHESGTEILCVADFYAHKRHDLILQAWRLLPEPRPRLRLIGNPSVDPATHAGVLELVASLPEADSVVVEHSLPLQGLVDAYRQARVFVIASEHESFCMPLAESMACGAPAVVRGLKSLRETGGEGARYLDSNDPSDWASTLHELISDHSEHDRARQAAIRAAKRYSWANLSAQLVDNLSQ